MPSDLDRPIVLIGMMGAGKTTVGRLLASQLGWEFSDNDAAIEAVSKRHPADLLRADAKRFRDLESKLIVDLLATSTQMVSSVGGGAVMNADTQTALRAHASVIWLRASIKTLLTRVMSEVESRPMLDGDPAERMSTLLAERTPIYAQLAQVVIDVDEITPEEAVETIIEELS